MAKIKHIALSTQDVDRTAAFYVNVFGMKEIARIDSPNARGYYLSDGDLNLAILNFKNDAAAGAYRPQRAFMLDASPGDGATAVREQVAHRRRHPERQAAVEHRSAQPGDAR